MMGNCMASTILYPCRWGMKLPGGTPRVLTMHSHSGGVIRALRVYLDLVARNKPTAYQPDPLLSLLYRADLPLQHQQPSLPLCYVQEDIQYGILRSTNNYDCRLEAGIKGSRPPYTHHNQPDTGSFYLNVRGERLLIDPGVL